MSASKSSTKKSTRRRKSSPAKKPSFRCYAVADENQVNFFATRQEAKDYIATDLEGDGYINSIVVASNQDLAKVLSDNVL